MPKGTVGSFYGTAQAGINLIPIFRANELEKNPDSFLKTTNMIVKKIAIAANTGTAFILNGSQFLMPSESFELAYGTMDISELKFVEDTKVTIAYIF